MFKTPIHIVYNLGHEITKYFTLRKLNYCVERTPIKQKKKKKIKSTSQAIAFYHLNNEHFRRLRCYRMKSFIFSNMIVIVV